MELFDRKFVHFMWDDELEGKKCFVANYIGALHAYVEKGDERYFEVERSNDADEPFQAKDGLMFSFAYYDPNYEAKRAFKEGKKVQVLDVNGSKWVDCDEPEWLDVCEYRIKPEEEEKCIVYLQRYDEECWLSTCYECEWKEVQKEQGAKTKLFVGSEDEVTEWYKTRQKFAKVIKAWEDGKQIQIRHTPNSDWVDLNNETPKWHACYEYRAKPEEKAVIAKRCSGCAHVNCSATKEPCASCLPGNSKYKEKKWRPYENSAEMIADFIARFKVNCPSYCEPLIWLKGHNTDNRYLVTGIFSEDGVRLSVGLYSLNELFNGYTYLDGSPCGMEVKE